MTATIETTAIDIIDLTNQADSVVYGIGSHLDHALLSPDAHTLWTAAGGILYGDKSAVDRIAYVLYLTAILDAPDAVQASLRALRASLQATLPPLT